jgi:hypothetical protein
MPCQCSGLITVNDVEELCGHQRLLLRFARFFKPAQHLIFPKVVENSFATYFGLIFNFPLIYTRY